MVDSIFWIFNTVAVVGGALLVAGALVAVAPRVIATIRQRSFDRATNEDRVRWILRLDPSTAADPDACRRLVAGLHPGARRGTAKWASGWPLLTLAVRMVDGRARFELEAPRQLARAIEAAVAAADLGAELEPAAARPKTRGVRLSLRGEAPPDRAEHGRDAFGAALVEVMSRVPRGAEATWALDVRPGIEAGVDRGNEGPGWGELFLDSLLGRPSRPGGTSTAPLERPTPSSAFTVTASLEAVAPAASSARAWLFDAASAIGALREGGWTVETSVGGGASAPIQLRARDLAELWGLSAGASPERAVDVVRSRRLRAPVVEASAPDSRSIAREGGRDVRVPANLFLRHAAFIGKTGSGKSTELVALAAEDLRSGRGFTFLDPHGDAVRRLLDCVPPAAVDRVHLLELAERQRPRSFNPLELDGADPELVAGQFVDTVRELYLGTAAPRQAHYLRNGLMTLLIKDPGTGGPWTILDLYELLVDPGRRKAFTLGLKDPVLAAFWEHEWPTRVGSGRDPSADALLNKLSSFVGYPSIRQIVAARRSSIRPRRIMDEGRVLLVDLSRVARDHGRLFGSLLIARYCIDALGRQEVPEGKRQPHQLYLDEAHAFDTSSLRTIVTETRKFGLGATLATQYFDRMGQELRDAVLNDVGTIGLLQPAAADARLLASSFAPLAERDLLGLERFRVAVRTELSGQATVFTADILPEPERFGQGEMVRRLSDQRDGHAA